MTTSVPAKARILSARRLVLLASVAGLGVAVLGGADLVTKASGPALSTVAYAQGVQRPMGFADIVEKVKPAVISVRVKLDAGPKMMGMEGNSPLAPNSQMERFFRRFGMPDMAPDERGQRNQIDPRAPRNRLVTGQGSGFFITADGYAVTNNHVVDKADTVEVTTDEGKTYTAKVIGTDPRTDLALIKVEGRSDFPYAKLSDRAPRIGDWVLAVGNPFGLGGTVTAGIVSARGRDIGAGPYDDFIQIDAPVNKGNSGGPTFDVDGNVIGVNTAIFSPSGGSVGIAFAIPAGTVKSVVAQLKDKGKVTPRLDRRADPARHCRHRRQPRPQGAGRRDGLRSAGEWSGCQSRHPGRRRDHQGQRCPGQGRHGSRQADRRHGARRNGEADRLAQGRGEDLLDRARRTAQPARGESGNAELSGRNADVPRLGLSVAPADQVAGSGSEGVVVTEVDPNGLASDQGFKTGDVILEVGGKKVANPVDVRTALTEAQKDGKRTILMRVKSGEETRFVAVRLAKA